MERGEGGSNGVTGQMWSMGVRRGTCRADGVRRRCMAWQLMGPAGQPMAPQQPSATQRTARPAIRPGGARRADGRTGSACGGGGGSGAGRVRHVTCRESRRFKRSKPPRAPRPASGRIAPRQKVLGHVAGTGAGPPMRVWLAPEPARTGAWRAAMAHGPLPRHAGAPRAAKAQGPSTRPCPAPQSARRPAARRAARRAQWPGSIRIPPSPQPARARAPSAYARGPGPSLPSAPPRGTRAAGPGPARAPAGAMVI